MKKFILFVFLAVSCSAFGQSYDSFGKKIKAKNAITADQLVQNMGGKAEMKAKVTGTVESVCQVKGCWMKLNLANGEQMRVSFKDYGFFMPKDISGKTITMEGIAKVKETSVAELKHYAEDAGKSKEEIEKITQPKKELTFVADGVLLHKN